MSRLGYASMMDGVEQDEGVSTRSAPSSDHSAGRAEDLRSLCPYLATADGNWRSSTPVREHRCVAVTPAVPLALDKQRRLCLVADHRTCATYGAAIAARPSYATDATPRGRVIARTTPVVLDEARFELRLPAVPTDRISGQGLLVGLLAIAFVAILIARPAGNPGSANGDSQPSPTPRATSAAVANATTRPSVSAASAPVVTARPVGGSSPSASTPPAMSLEPSNSPAPSSPPVASGSTYRVKSGDTLTAIAARFKTTVKTLTALNHITDPSKLHVGQVLQLP
jgi:LysM repeat protein